MSVQDIPAIAGHVTLLGSDGTWLQASAVTAETCLWTNLGPKTPLHVADLGVHQRLYCHEGLTSSTDVWIDNAWCAMSNVGTRCDGSGIVFVFDESVVLLASEQHKLYIGIPRVPFTLGGASDTRETITSTVRSVNNELVRFHIVTTSVQ